jgi:hypothetical protein
MDLVKSVITLRSGKVIEKPTLEPCKKDDESIFEGKEGVESEHCKEKTDSPPTLHFPHAMTKQRKVNHNSEIFETFKQVRINIPKGKGYYIICKKKIDNIDDNKNIDKFGFIASLT